jgi:hypothetical protein
VLAEQLSPLGLLLSASDGGREVRHARVAEPHGGPVAHPALPRATCLQLLYRCFEGSHNIPTINAPKNNGKNSLTLSVQLEV